MLTIARTCHTAGRPVETAIVIPVERHALGYELPVG